MRNTALRALERAGGGAEEGPVLSLESGRRTDRLDVSIQIRVNAKGGSETPRSYLSRDLNAHGLFVRTVHPFEAGTRVQLEFALPKVRVFRLEGEVVRLARITEVAMPGDAGMGIEFRDLSTVDSAALRKYLEMRK